MYSHCVSQDRGWGLYLPVEESKTTINNNLISTQVRDIDR